VSASASGSRAKAGWCAGCRRAARAIPTFSEPVELAQRRAHSFVWFCLNRKRSSTIVRGSTRPHWHEKAPHEAGQSVMWGKKTPGSNQRRTRRAWTQCAPDRRSSAPAEPTRRACGWSRSSLPHRVSAQRREPAAATAILSSRRHHD
jgi:hypothetical protein